MRPIRNSAKAIIIEAGKLLAIKLIDERGYWYTLPGGGQESGESLDLALRRECREEIGCEIEVGDIRFIRDYIGRNHEFVYADSQTHQVEFMFICQLAEGASPQPGAVPDTNQVGLEWLDLDKLDSYRLYPLGLRALIPRHPNPDVPVYVGDIN